MSPTNEKLFSYPQSLLNRIKCPVCHEYTTGLLTVTMPGFFNLAQGERVPIVDKYLWPCQHYIDDAQEEAIVAEITRGGI